VPLPASSIDLKSATTNLRGTHALPTPPRRRGVTIDMKTLRLLYIDEGRTEAQIAQHLDVSRTRVAEAMERAGIARRTTQRTCPLSAEDLRTAFGAPGATKASLARRFRVSAATIGRWLADAGLLSPDPRIDHRRLEKLYVEEALTTREVAEKLRITPERVRRELAISGIPARSNHVRRPRENRAKVTDRLLVELYVKKKYSVVEVATVLQVGTEYVRKRLHEIGLTKRQGTFTPHTKWESSELRLRAAELYESGLSMKAVGEELRVSVGTVRVALHEAGVPVRRGGASAKREEGRILLDDLYADQDVLRGLAHHGVVVPDEWTPAGPFESLAPLPLSMGLVTELYERVGLPIFHISLLLGVGRGAVRSGLKRAGVTLREPGQQAPWTVRRNSS
jgi:transposase